jgi:hypothetical protein
MTIILGSINVALFVLIAVALAFKHRQSGQAGFLWLIMPLALLPLIGVVVANWIEVSVDGLQTTPPNVTFPFSLVESGRMSLGRVLSLLNMVQHLVWSTLVLVGILMFRRRQAHARNA